MNGRMLRRMYAVVTKDGSIVAGSVAYSAAAAIAHFVGDGRKYNLRDWKEFKQAGYHTAKVGICIEDQQ